jgi:hypothetical protein
MRKSGGYFQAGMAASLAKGNRLQAGASRDRQENPTPQQFQGFALLLQILKKKPFFEIPSGKEPFHSKTPRK